MPAGRPTRWNPDRAAAIVGTARDGTRPVDAAKSTGIGPTTWNRWLDFGRAGRPGFAEMLEAVEQAEAEWWADYRAMREAEWEAYTPIWEANRAKFAAIG